METTITIIEGPPPLFEPVQDGWALSLSEGPSSLVNAVTKLRTYNGPELVERCYRAWKSSETMLLLYRNEMGLAQEAPIQAARTVNTDDGHILLLWVYLDPEIVAFEVNRRDDDNADDRFDR